MLLLVIENPCAPETRGEGSLLSPEAATLERVPKSRHARSLVSVHGKGLGEGRWASLAQES